MTTQLMLLCSVLALVAGEPPVGYPPSQGGYQDSYSLQSSKNTFEPPAARVSFNLFRSSTGRKAMSKSSYSPDLTSATFGKQEMPRALYGAPETDRLPVVADLRSAHKPMSSFKAPKQSYGPPSQSYAAPSQSYNAPRQSYGAPGKSYGAPSQSYGAPSQSYGAPGKSYGAPSQSYGAPSQSYGAPSSTYDAPTSHSSFKSSPSSSYGAPENTYGAPSSSYDAPTSHSTFKSAPSSSYGAPASTYGAPSSTYGAPSPQLNSLYGPPMHKNSEDYMSEPANYDFLYDVNSKDGSEFGHKESREGENAHGRYHVLLPDGRMQVVEYTADEWGYKPSISYEEGYPDSRSSAEGPY